MNYRLDVNLQLLLEEMCNLQGTSHIVVHFPSQGSYDFGLNFVEFDFIWNPCSNFLFSQARACNNVVRLFDHVFMLNFVSGNM